jgi:hypothetical protein
MTCQPEDSSSSINRRLAAAAVKPQAAVITVATGLTALEMQMEMR